MSATRKPTLVLAKYKKTNLYCQQQAEVFIYYLLFILRKEILGS